MTTQQSPPRSVVLAITTIVALFTSVIMVNAVQTITTPNATRVSQVLASGAIGVAISPARDCGVLLLGTGLTIGNRGVGQSTLLVPSPAPNFVEWVSLESPAACAVTCGFSATPGTHIVYIDYSHTMDVEVNSAVSIRVHNSNASAQTYCLTLIW